MQDVVASAVEAGWNEEEALVAIGALSDHLMLGSASNDTLMALLAELRRRS